MLLMCISNFNVQVFAEGETIPLEEKTYSATYEFVLDEEGELPEEVIALLPETKIRDILAEHAVNGAIDLSKDYGMFICRNSGLWRCL